MFFREDNTYNEIREKSMRQWLTDLEQSEDVVNRGGAKLTLEYLEYLNRKIRELEDKNKLKDQYLKKMKEKLINENKKHL